MAKRSNSMWILSLLISLLTSQTLATELSEIPSNWSSLPEIHLKKGDVAPNEGVLVPDLNYRNYKADEEYNKYLIEKAAEKTGPQVVTIDELSGWDKLKWFLLGITAALIISH